MAVLRSFSVAVLSLSPGLAIVGAYERVVAEQVQQARSVLVKPSGGVSEEEQRTIEAAIPKTALVTPAKPRKLLVFDSNDSGMYHVYAYRLADRATVKLSPGDYSNNQFADFEGIPK